MFNKVLCTEIALEVGSARVAQARVTQCSSPHHSCQIEHTTPPSAATSAYMPRRYRVAADVLRTLDWVSRHDLYDKLSRSRLEPTVVRVSVPAAPLCNSL